MGNTTSMKDPHMKGPHMKGPHMKGTNEHQHGDVTCTMKHGRRRRHHRTAKHDGKKHNGKKHHGTKHKRRRYAGGTFTISPPLPE